MKIIKTACLSNINYIKYPNGINTIEEFVEFINNRFNSFVKLEVFSEENCVAPYFIEDKIGVEYFNTTLIRRITEEEIHILTENEYAERLEKVIAEKCIHCVNYSENACKEDMESHREHINLDGECYGFEKKE